MLVYRGMEKVTQDYTSTKGAGLEPGLAWQLSGLLIRFWRGLWGYCRMFDSLSEESKQWTFHRSVECMGVHKLCTYAYMHWLCQYKWADSHRDTR